MKKYIATALRRLAQKLDPQPAEVTGYARKVVDFIPYYGIDKYRDLLVHGEDDKARLLKLRIRNHVEISAMALLAESLEANGNIRFEHNFGTQEKEVNGIKCQPEGVTVILELKGYWS